MDVGQILRERREALGYTLEDVQAATKIRLRYLQAIEAGRVQDLPGPVYTRGFIRSYATFVELDGFALAAAWQRPAEAAEAEPGAPATPAAPPASAASGAPAAPAPQGDSRPALILQPYAARRPAIIGLWVVALVAIVAAVVVWRASAHAPGPAAAAGVTASAGSHASPTATASPAATATATGAAASATASATAPAPRVTASTVTDAAGNPVTTYTVSGAKDLAVTARVTARCWLDVTVDGSPADPNLTMEPGQSRSWQGSQQVAMRIGYPPGIALSVDGVAIPAYQGQSPINVAFVLGK